MSLPHIEWEVLSGLKVLKFECIGGNLGWGQFWETIPTLEAISV